jgi:signal transduction histidine kinase
VAAFAGAALAAVLVIAGAVVWVAHGDATRAAVDEGRHVAVADAAAAVTPALTDAVARGDPAALRTLDHMVRDRVLSEQVVRVKLWRADGTIIYSDQPELIGRRFDLAANELRALAGGPPAADMTDLRDPENVFERQFHKLVEVYVGVRTPTGQPLLFEVYMQFSSLSRASERTVTAMVPALLAGLGLLFLVQLPLAWSLARRVARARAEERRLLQRAVEAGDVERRQIAADLHDGVVQSLAGTAMSLVAVADGAERAGLTQVADAVSESASVLRQGVRDLRSLIVAIAPPRLYEEGLEAALSDLVSPLEANGIATEVSVDDAVRLDEDDLVLVYRAAQEALRNVVRHAGAQHVTVHLATTGGRVRLAVRDDGVGFDAEQAGHHHANGHAGLRLLTDLATSAGGQMTVDAAPGGGTTLALELPER